MDNTEAALRLVAWREVAAWLDYAAAEFADAASGAYLERIAMCVREEAERRHARAAGAMPVRLR